jgi:membrane glycosyltransferase
VNPAAREAEDRAFQRLAPIFHSIHGGTGDPPVRSGDSPLGTPHDSESEVPPAGRLFLIRRENRQKFKAGNIAHVLETHGHAYDFMLVLDADSVMTGAKIRRLITQLQARPKTALIQTLMFPIRSRTLFARAMQFGIARSLPIFGHGMAWFFGRESVYWGHNALIRVHPFMAHCNLPIMPGEPPLGGDIMSHDIVEAALLGRAGWSIDWDLEPGGSFDELPANILTYGQRDRRWCQGNFQHFWLAFGDGMKFGHRFYLAGGILGYLMGPLLLLLAVIGFVQGLRGRVYDPTTVMVASFIFFLFVLTTVPKVLGYFALPRAQRRPWPELLSGFIDLVVSFIMSWALFYLHTQFVIGLLCGRMVPWVSQSRNPEEGVEWRTAARLFWLPTVLGLLWLWAAWRYTPSFIIFLIPILIGWILSIPMAVLTSSAALGDWFARRGLLRDNLSPADIAELGPLHEESGGSRQLLDPDNPIPARPIPTTS